MLWHISICPSLNHLRLFYWGPGLRAWQFIWSWYLYLFLESKKFRYQYWTLFLLLKPSVKYHHTFYLFKSAQTVPCKIAEPLLISFYFASKETRLFLNIFKASSSSSPGFLKVFQTFFSPVLVPDLILVECFFCLLSRLTLTCESFKHKKKHYTWQRTNFKLYLDGVYYKQPVLDLWKMPKMSRFDMQSIIERFCHGSWKCWRSCQQTWWNSEHRNTPSDFDPLCNTMWKESD